MVVVGRRRAAGGGCRFSWHDGGCPRPGPPGRAGARLWMKVPLWTTRRPV